jgi:hypothetical protein
MSRRITRECSNPISNSFFKTTYRIYCLVSDAENVVYKPSGNIAV